MGNDMKNKVTRTWFIIPLPRSCTFSVTTRSDFGIWKPSEKEHMLIGWSRDKQRVNAVSHISMIMIIFGPFGFTFSKMYVRR